MKSPLHEVKKVHGIDFALHFISLYGDVFKCKFDQ